MSPTVIDLRKAEDARDVVHRAVQALAEGHAVAFPTECDYVAAAAVRIPAAVERIRDLAHPRVDEPRLTLAVKGGDEAIDWAPRLGPLGRRLARRCWPGPLAMLVADRHPESLVSRLPAAVQATLLDGSRLRLRCPAHPMLIDCMRLLAGPVALAEFGEAGRPVLTVDDLLTAAGPASSGLSLVIDDGESRYGQPVSTIAIDDAGFRMVRTGVVSEESLRQLSSLMILFVCTGNTCRSPMAEAVLRSLFAERLGCRPEQVAKKGVVITSAGIAAWSGSHASGHAIDVMASMGCDLVGHESQPLTESLVRQADLIFTMTAAHRAAILAQFPEAEGRVSMLSPDRADVLDPIGGSPAVYRKCAEQIREQLLTRLDTLLGQMGGEASAAVSP